MKIEIDLTKEIESAVEKEVKSKMEKGGLLRFIRDITTNEAKKSGVKSQVRQQETEIMQIKKKLKYCYEALT